MVGLHLILARHVAVPARGPGDQWGYLGNARFLAGDPHVWVLPSFPYFTWGYSIVLAPLVRLVHGPESLYLAIKVLNAGLAASVFPLLYAFGRRLLGAPRSIAVAAAATGSVVPPLMAHPTSILAENLVLPLAVATMLACHAFLSERPAWQRLLFAPAMVWLHITHNRFAATLPLFILVLVLAWRRRWAPRWVTLVNGVVAVSLLLIAQVVRNRLVSQRWVYGIETPQGPAADAIDFLHDRHLAQEALLVGAGQLWYVLAGSLGLAGLGIVLVARRTAWWSSTSGPDAPARRTLAFLLGSALTVLATSTYFFTRVANGSEGFIAGRHNDSFSPMWVAAGVVFLLTSTRPLLRRTLAGSMVLVAGLGGLVLQVRSATDVRDLYSSLNVPAVVHLAEFGDEPLTAASWIAAGAISGAWLLSWSRSQIVALLVPLTMGYFIVTVGGAIAPDPSNAGWHAPEQLAPFELERAAVVQSRNGGFPVFYPYFLPDVVVIPWDGTGQAPEPFVFATLDAVGLADAGGRVAMIDEPYAEAFGAQYALALWVMPGPDQARLAAAGALVPPEFPSALPEGAQRAEVIIDHPAVALEAGAAADIRVVLRHVGSSSPWPDAGSVGPTGSVQLVTRSVGPRGAQGRAPRPALAALPRWVQPGDSVAVVLRVEATDPEGRALPPGRYRLRVELEQAGFLRFDGIDPKSNTAADIVLDVR